ncbi:uncharacterized protein ISCGN_010321 [Ixodes scapularis]
MAVHLRDNPEVRALIEHVKGQGSTVPRAFVRTLPTFSIRQGMLYKENFSDNNTAWLLVILSSLREEIFQACHDDPTAGLFGYCRTLARKREKYYWPKLAKTVHHYARSCHEHQQRKKPPTRPAGLFQTIAPPSAPFQQIEVDLLRTIPTIDTRKPMDDRRNRLSHTLRRDESPSVRWLLNEPKKFASSPDSEFKINSVSTLPGTTFVGSMFASSPKTVCGFGPRYDDAKHNDADCLSRAPVEASPASIDDDDDEYFLGGQDVTNMAVHLRDNPEVRALIEHVKGQGSTVPRAFVRTLPTFSIRQGMLYKENFSDNNTAWLLVILSSLREEIFQACHDDPTAGLFGYCRTLARKREKYYWPKLAKTVHHYARSCHEHQQRKKPPTRPAGLFQTIAPPSAPFQQIEVDLLRTIPTIDTRKPMDDRRNRLSHTLRRDESPSVRWLLNEPKKFASSPDSEFKINSVSTLPGTTFVGSMFASSPKTVCGFGPRYDDAV